MRAPRTGTGPFLVRTPAAAFAAGALSLGFVACGGGGGSGTGEESEESVPLHEQGVFLHLTAPSIIARGEETAIVLRVVTQAGLPDYDFEGSFRIDSSSPETEFPARPRMEATELGTYRMAGLKFHAPGVQFLRGLVPGDTVEALANPFVVMDDPEYRIFWGDLNGHSDLSDGERGPGLYAWYARAVALLDFAAITDNDALEGEDSALTDEAFAEVLEILAENDVPGEFVPLAGFEWSSSLYGHRLVYLSEPPSALPTVATGHDTPAKLRAALPPGSVVAIAHPSGSERNPPVDPATAGAGGEELVEVYSSLGTFEAPDPIRPTTRETPGAHVTALLSRGFRPGFIASSDTRITLPGNPRVLATAEHPWPGGLTAILAKELTREAVLDALRQRRCYATTGPRYLLEFTVDGEQMGSELRVERGHRAEVYGSLGSTTKWLLAELVGPKGPLAELSPDPEAADVIELTATTEPIEEPTWVYLRGIDETGGMAWSSPVYLIPE
jgi:hypothetical protein